MPGGILLLTTRTAVAHEGHGCMRVKTDARPGVQQVVVEDAADVKSGYSIVFSFAENPFFSNRTLEKRYVYYDDGTAETLGTQPDWFPGKARAPWPPPRMPLAVPACYTRASCLPLDPPLSTSTVLRYLLLVGRNGAEPASCPPAMTPPWLDLMTLSGGAALRDRAGLSQTGPAGMHGASLL